jgi:hypothetical protein
MPDLRRLDFRETETVYFLAFEAKSIQDWITSGGKLRDLAGGSVLVDSIAQYPETGEAPSSSVKTRHDCVGELTEMLGLSEKIRFSRRAGGAFLAIADDKQDLARLRAAMVITMSSKAPGLQFVDALIEAASFGEMLVRLPAALNASRARPRSGGPFPGPFVKQAPRSGYAAAGVDPRRGDDVIDRATMAKRAVIDYARDHGELLPVEAMFISPSMRTEAAGKAILFPLTVEQEDDSGSAAADVFPFVSENKTIAVMHADGNLLGQTLISLGDAVRQKNPPGAERLFYALSIAIARATRDAARQATYAALWPLRTEADDAGGQPCLVLPARPIVLGGDDLTIILRGDAGLPFTEAYLTAFEQETRGAIADLRQKFAGDPAISALLTDKAIFPDALSAGAGLVFVGASQPFSDAAHFAEELAREAKSAAKASVKAGALPPSSLSLMRITTTSLPTLRDYMANALTIHDGPSVRIMTANPYVLSDPGVPGMTPLKVLKDMHSVVSSGAISSNGLRRYVGSLEKNPAEAAKTYRRWREIAGKTVDRRAQLQVFDTALDLIGAPDSKTEPPLFRKRAGSGAALITPILDALSLEMAQKVAS